MKTTKALILLFVFFLTIGYFEAQAQSPYAAYTAFQAGTLDKAKEAIDDAVTKLKEKNEKAKEKGKDPKEKPDIWYVKTIIYSSIANDQTGLYQDLSDNPVEQAKAAYEKAASLDPEKSDQYAEQATQSLYAAAINFGAKQFEQEKTTAAMNNFMLGAELNPEDTLGSKYAAELAFQEKNYEIFEKATQMFLDSDAKDKTRAYVLYASYLNEKGEKEKALEIVENSLKNEKADADKDSYDFLKKLAFQLYVDLKRTDEAIAWLKQSAEDNPENAHESLANLGLLYEEKGDTAKALEAYDKSFEMKPNFKAYFNAGVLFFNRGVEIKKEADQMDLAEYNKKGKAIEEQAKVEFKKALPYFETIYEKGLAESEGDKIKMLGPLSQLYNNILDMKDKGKKVQKELDMLMGADSE